MSPPVNVICMKWGTLYGPHYVNRLRNMVRRHLARPHRFMCFTDDPVGLAPDIETAPTPEITLAPEHVMRPWRKIGLFNRRLADLEGPTLFLDLDIVIVGGLDAFFDHAPGKFCIIHNWTHPDRIVGNSSVYRFEVGADSYVLDRFHSQPHQHWIDQYRNSQTFLSHSVRELTYWPSEWCVSFKHNCLPGGHRFPGILLNRLLPARLPPKARIVVFHGHPNPDEALEGRWPGGWHKGLRPTRWIADHWRE